MRARRFPFGLIVPALLIGLVVLLATLQYQWLGKVSEAEREQLTRSLNQRAREFADEFDREISQAYTMLRMPREVLTSGNWTPWTDAYDRWRATAKYPGIVDAVYLAQPGDGGSSLRPYDAAARSFAAAPLVEWPPGLREVRLQIDRTSTPARTVSTDVGGTRIVTLTLTPVAADGSALLIPVMGVPMFLGTQGGAGVAVGSSPTLPSPPKIDQPQTLVVIELDHDYIRKTMLPSLIERNFPEHGADAYRVAVVSGKGDTLAVRGFADTVPIDPARTDVTAPLFSVRFDPMRENAVPTDVMLFRSLLPPGGNTVPGHNLPAPGRVSVIVEQRAVGNTIVSSRGGAAASLVRAGGPGWRIVAQHAAGSLDVAVAQARRRNLALSFSILAVLAAGVVLVVANARRAQVLAAKQIDFVATVTHELRTPLAVIRSAAQNLSAGVVAEPAQAKRYGELIDSEGRRLTETVEQVLAYAGLEGGKAPQMAQSVDLGRLVADVLDASQASFDAAGIVIEHDAAAAAGLPTVRGDEHGLRLAVQNVVNNALKHGADGKWMSVAVDEAAYHGQPEIRVTVRDRGRGIAPADIGHVFEPFYRGSRALDAQVRGNGLGLSLVKRIVEAHGGRVMVESSAGAGASFVLCLPAGARA